MVPAPLKKWLLRGGNRCPSGSHRWAVSPTYAGLRDDIVAGDEHPICEVETRDSKRIYYRIWQSNMAAGNQRIKILMGKTSIKYGYIMIYLNILRDDMKGGIHPVTQCGKQAMWEVFEPRIYGNLGVNDWVYSMIFFFF